MVVCPAVNTYSTTAVVGGSSCSVPYPTGITEGDLLFLCVQGGDFQSVPNVTPSLAGWTNLYHFWGSNNYVINLYSRVADGTESGSVVVDHGGGANSNGVMIRLDSADQSHGPIAAGSDVMPSLTPSDSSQMLLAFAGVPNGTRDTSYSNDGMCLLDGVAGGVYIQNSQIYAEVLQSQAPTGTRSWSGEGSGAVAPWRHAIGVLVSVGKIGGWQVGSLGFG